MENVRVAITGVGAICSVGLTASTTMEALLQGRSGVRRIQRFDPASLSTRIAAEVLDFDPTQYMDRKDAKRADRYSQLAIAAAREAVAQAQLESSSVDPNRIGVVLGSGIGGIDTFEVQHRAMVEKGPGRVSPFFIPMMISDMAAGLVSMAWGFKGPNFSNVSACASAANALGTSFLLIQAGHADAVVTGGSEASITLMSMAGFCSMKAMSEQNDRPEAASRPFDAKRDGFVMGEGAGILVLERLDRARARGAPILGEMVGFGMTGDAHHMTAPAPEGEGAARAMQTALDMAGVQPDVVDYINAHGTSTPYNDKNETQAIKKVFGAHAKKLKVGSTKSMIGHLLGASGGIESVISVLVLGARKVPPTINQEFPDPDCDLDCIPNVAVPLDVHYALSNSFGFGGHNVSILFKRYEG
ncbi:MAG TPA: beta-ketoacyl-ACP synthase II [Candidatus Krumholzibacteria bacterium]|nr:beta-ketoacyl-ACP synthase II [Candidatus Krumholzibacteria bacterium]